MPDDGQQGRFWTALAGSDPQIRLNLQKRRIGREQRRSVKKSIKSKSKSYYHVANLELNVSGLKGARRVSASGDNLHSRFVALPASEVLVVKSQTSDVGIL